MNRNDFDLSVYLVTDSGMVPDGLTFLGQVEAAIRGGVTCVQLREKDIETKDFIDRAKAVKELTDAANIPLIIDDRLDVALAVGANLHIGQDDMDASIARELLGEDKILGVSVSTVEETKKAIDDGADYVGIGLCFSTNTKVTKKIPKGPRGAQPLLRAIYEKGSDMKTCLIGGINQSNVSRVRYQSGIPQKRLDGVAVVSAIMAQNDAFKAAKDLVTGWNSTPQWCTVIGGKRPEISGLLNHPLIHHITNNVVKNFSANVTLAIGASPIMSECIEEFDELAAIAGGLVLNSGEISQDNVPLYTSALQAYNKHNKPIVYDPVGCSASTFRSNFTQMILVEGYLTVIKGNQDEILTAAGAILGTSGGVDSVSRLGMVELLDIAKKFALSTRSIVVVTGEKDLVVDGVFEGQTDLVDCHIGQQKFQFISGGSPMMTQVTGTGCSLGSVICAFVAAYRDHPFEATVSACSLYKKAGTVAGKLATFKGPGTFQYLFLDALNQYSSGVDTEDADIESGQSDEESERTDESILY
ncbi:DEKNAAC104948 [Brettanomyces naardenensis]|uniref:DEKNAAC104948 n=1 Tax=Brettanomyces naardenensis TaxID=13370 RepID=A0A448YS03_BRENA|nr:DEKNAAC104948 [Brettanomyces naardenensis]